MKHVVKVVGLMKYVVKDVKYVDGYKSDKLYGAEEDVNTS